MSSSYDSAQTLSIEGSDALPFAQAQFSCQIAALEDGHWQFGAWLDAQGRVLALFHLARLSDQRLLLLLRGGDAESMASALRRYVFRSKVSLRANVRTLSGGPALPMHHVAAEGDVVLFGCGSHSLRVDTATATENTSDNHAWLATQLSEGWPWLPDALLGKLLPPALSLERLQAVSFTKGCYPGQEIVARLHYRGGHKWHLHRVVLSRPINAGTTLHFDGHEAAQVLVAFDGTADVDALVVLRDDASGDVARDFADDQGQVVQLVSQQPWPA